ncbi:MAG TPA: Fur family transcriptional regulator [Acidimicrobiia bacterium]
METRQSLIEALRREGMRVTAPRRAICTVLAEPDLGHLSVAELQARAEEVLGRSIDLSTVYRTVDALQEAGIVHHVHLGHGASVIHRTEEEHHHLVCDVCGRTVDLPLGELGPLAALLEKYGYEPGTVHFAIVSRCLSHRNDAGPALD